VKLRNPSTSRFGIEILKRTPLSDRQRYSMAAIRFKFDPSATEPAVLSKGRVSTFATQVLAQVRKTPGAFAELHRSIVART